jgi:hypothetical protein
MFVDETTETYHTAPYLSDDDDMDDDGEDETEDDMDDDEQDTL